MASPWLVYRTLVTIALVMIPMVAAWDYGGVLAHTQWYLSLAVLLVFVLGLPIWFDWLRTLGSVSRKSTEPNLESGESQALGRDSSTPSNRSEVSIAPRSERVRWSAVTWAVAIPVLVLAMVVIGHLQTWTYPSVIVAWFSPGTSAAYTQWIPSGLDDLRLDDSRLRGESSSVAGSLGWRERLDPMLATHPTSRGVSVAQAHPLSIAPWMTRRALYVPAVFGFVLLMATALFVDPDRARLMLLLTGSFGALIAFMGLADIISSPVRDQLITVTGHRSAPFGPFVNRNNAGGFLNLSLAAWVGYLVWGHTVMEARRANQRRYDTSSDEGWWTRILMSIRSIITTCEQAPFAFVAVVFVLTAIVSCGSRGAVLGTFAGVLGVVMLRAYRGSSRGDAAQAFVGKLMLVMLVVVVAGVISFTDFAGTRLATLWNQDLAHEGRLQHWGDAMVAAVHYLPMGAGLGTYRHAYLPYQQRTSAGWCINADSMPVEWLVEGGLWLLPMVVVCIVLLLRMLLRLSRHQRSPQASAMLAGGAFLICSQVISQSFDFGILLPSNLITIALLVGAVIAATIVGEEKRGPRIDTTHGRRRSGEPQQKTAARQPGWLVVLLRKFMIRVAPGIDAGVRWTNHLSPWVARGLFVLFALSAVLAAIDAARDATTDYYARGLSRADAEAWFSDPEGRQGTWIESAMDLRESGRVHPLDAQAALAQATATVLRDQWSAMQAAAASDPAAASQVFAAAMPRTRRAVYFLRDVTGYDPPRRGLMAGQSVDRLRKARRLAREALWVSPLNDQARWRLVTLDFLDDSLSNDSLAAILDQATRLRINSPDVLSPLAELASVHPGGDAATMIWRRLLELQPQRIQEVWKWLVLTDQTDRLLDAVPDNLSIYAEMVETLPGSALQKDLWLTKAKELMESLPVPSPDDPHDQFSRARLSEAMSDWSAAQVHFERAVKADPTHTAWRYRLVLAAEKNGDYQTAREQIHHCLLQSPHHVPYREKAKRLEVRGVRG